MGERNNDGNGKKRIVQELVSELIWTDNRSLIKFEKNFVPNRSCRNDIKIYLL